MEYAVIGTSSNSAVIAKYSSTLDLQWAKSFGAYTTTTARSIIENNNSGNFIGLAQASPGSMFGNKDGILFRFNSGGSLLSSYAIGGTNDDDAYSLFLTRNRDYALSGGSSNLNGDVAFVLVVDSSLSLQWGRTWSSTGGNYQPYHLIELQDGSLFFCGDNTSSSGSTFFCGRMDSSGNLMVAK